MTLERHDAIVVGSGLAGLTAALSLGPGTLLITKTPALVGGSTPWAQGGVAFPRDTADEALHLSDTLSAGAGHSDPEAVGELVGRAAAARSWLEGQGLVFDRNPDGSYQYGQEGAHSARRILHAGRDATGAVLATTLAAVAAGSPGLQVRTSTLAVALEPGALLTLDAGGQWRRLLSPRLILAGGGPGQLYDATTAPAEGTGDTLTLAHEAGAALRDLEMVQFHPTALDRRAKGSSSLALLTEALRGEGALLVTGPADHPSPLDTGHPRGALGPRDVLSRAIFRRREAGDQVWLDARGVPGVRTRFPTVTRLCAAWNLDPARDLLPVVPAVHYTMGGIDVDLRGRTAVPGVWAVGEAARTGVHGANRLASNSLLECVVWARAAAADAAVHPGPSAADTEPALWRQRQTDPVPGPAVAAELRAALGAVMTRAAGPVRSAAGLQAGLNDVHALRDRWDTAARGGPTWGALTFAEAVAILEARSLLHLAPLVLSQALDRPRSLGAHFRGDDPWPNAT